MARENESLADALAAIKRITDSPLDQIEGAPKPGGSAGPIPRRDWIDIRRDLADLPRGERWAIRKKGSGGKDYVVVLLPLSEHEKGLPAVSLVEAHRVIDAEKWTSMDMRATVLEEKAEALEVISKLQMQVSTVLQSSIQNANNAQANANLITELISAMSEMTDELHSEKKQNRNAMALWHTINRVLTMVIARKAKSLDELKKIPELKAVVDEYLEWKLQKETPTPKGDPADSDLDQDEA